MIKVDDLSKLQQEIVNLKTDRSYVIQGGPGTGKTVIAVNRAKLLSDEGKHSVILVYNRPLMKYIQSVVTKLGIEKFCNVKTYNSWVYRIYKTNSKTIPNINGNGFDYDYEQILKDFDEGLLGSIPSDCEGDYVLLDEAQDFPPMLLRFIKKVLKNVTCFIDSNQSIQNDKTSLAEALAEIDVETARTLDVNYRNTDEMSALARLYWDGKGIFPKTNRKGTKPKMVKCSDNEERIEKIAEIAKKYIFKDEESSVGVFVNTTEEVQDMVEILSKKLGEDYIQYWIDRDNENIDFSKSGVKIFTFGKIKGLDFDAIIIGDNISERSGRQIADKNTIYMTLTRAAQNLYICYKDEIEDGCIDFLSEIKENKDLCEWI